MLKKIAPLISPELIKILMEMGHTDEIVICDGNMPACTLGKRVVRLDGHNVPEILKAILELMPLDPTVEQPAAICRWDGPDAPIWDEYAKIISESEEADKFQHGLKMLPPAEFNAAVANAYCLITTSEKALAANIILIKNPNDNTLLAIEDDNFTPQKVDYVPTYIPEPKIINDTNLTNKTDWMNNANITNILNKTKGNLSNLWNEYSHW